MRLGHRGICPPAPHRRAAKAQLRQQVVPFVLQLAARYGKRGFLAARSELAPIECKAPLPGLAVNGFQIKLDGAQRSRVSPESVQLRVVEVSARLAAKDLPRKKSLAPESDQPARIEIPGMKGPEPHEAAIIRDCGPRLRACAGSFFGRSCLHRVRRDVV